MKKPTMKDVARLAGVGLATVDRVLNERGETSVDVTRKVIEAARTLGMRRQLPDPYERLRLLHFVLPPPDTDFRRRLLAKLEMIRNRLDQRIRVSIGFAEPADPAAVVAALAGVQSEAVGFCYWGQGSPQVQAAVDALHARAVKVFCLLNRPPALHCDGYFGTDNEAAGRTAAFLAKGRLGERREVLVLTPMLDNTGPNARVSGFETAMLQHVPGSRVVEVVETRNNPALVAATLKRVLARHPQLGMVYNIGSGAEGMRAALQQALPDAPLFVVTHELTQETQALLKAHLVDYVLDQNLSLTMGTAIHQMMRCLQEECAPGVVALHTPFSIYCPENVGDEL